MSKTCIEKLPHSCGSRRGLQVFQKDDGTIDGYCFSCDTFVAHPYGDGPVPNIEARPKKTPEVIKAELDEIATYKTVDIASRKLRGDVLDYFGVKVGLDEERGEEPVQVYFPYTKDGRVVGYKTRSIANKEIMYCIGSMKDVDLFGWEQAVASGAKRLIIAEGEFDAIAMRRILELYTKEGFREHMPAVVSLISGASSAAKDISRLSQRIRAHFKEVVLAFDMDDPGREAVEKTCRIFPGALGVTLPAKDANACLTEGKGKACFNAVTFKSEAAKNTRLVMGSSLREAARKEAEWGYSWPWQHINKVTRGIRLGETIYIGAGVKMGKSEIVNALATHCILEHKWKVFMAKPEEANRKTYQLLVGKAAGKIFHDPTIPFDYVAYDNAEPLIGDNVVLVNLYQHLGWETLKADIYEAASMGCKAVFIDPITNLTNNVGSAEANERLTAIAADLSAMALDLGIVIFIFCHLKAPEYGDPHERGGKVLSTQFAGSRAMMRSCNMMIGIEGNKDPDIDEGQRHVRQLVLLEDREFGQTGRFPLYWNPHNALFAEM